MSRHKLGDLLKIQHGYAFKSDNYVAKSQYRLVTLGNFASGNSFKYNDEKATYYGAEFPKEFILEDGDLIMPMTEQVIGLFGNTAFIPETTDYTFVLNQRVGKVIYDEKKVDKYYLHYLLATNSVKQQIEARASGTRQRNISPENVYDVEVDIPDISVQERIGRFLYLLEEKQIMNNKTIQELETMAKTIYDYWFLQFNFPNEEGKPYKSSGGKMVWNEELGREIPEGWNSTTVGEITECYDSSRIPLSAAERKNKKGRIPYYGATGIMDYIDQYIFDGDYVLMAEDGSVMNEKGNPILQRINGRTWVNNHAHVLRPSKLHSCKLLMMMLKDVSVMKIKTGSIQMKINQENMNKIVVPEIPEVLIKKINVLLNDIDRQILHRPESVNLTSKYMRRSNLPHK